MACLEDHSSCLHFFDAEGSMGKKVLTHKRHLGGLEAPRNSLELPVETSYGLCSVRDNILYAYHMTKESSNKNYHRPEAPMKKLIREEISERTIMKRNSPSVVARLMGVETLPFDSKAAPRLVAVENRTPAPELLDMERIEKSLNCHVLSMPNSSQQLDICSFGHCLDSYSHIRGERAKFNRPKPREHPQEEELQKFKKEFEAWQAARFKECSKVVGFSTHSIELIAQADLNRERMVHYSSCQPRGQKDLALLADPQNTPTTVKCKMENKSQVSNGISPSQMMKSDRGADKNSTPTKIVILRPGPDGTSLDGDSWNNTPRHLEERNSMEDFLEEVKEKLKAELQGKSSKRSTTARGGGIETPYWEKPSEPRRMAQQVSQHMMREFGVNFLRSDSTRSSRSEVDFHGAGSPEFINRGTRKFLAERLTNVLKAEPRFEIQTAVHNRSKQLRSDSDKDSGKRRTRDLWNGNRISFPESFTYEVEKQSKSFRRELDNNGKQPKEMSPRNLIRSMSAPVSGTSFGKLLLEDRCIVTGAQIRRKHEVVEKIWVSSKKPKKDKFNLREKVSSFKHSFTLRGRLFRRRVKSIDVPLENKPDFLKDIATELTVTTSFCETHENPTEVPPSPASMCSSYEDFSKPTEHLSPAESSSVSHLEETELPDVFREINSNLNELRRKLNQLEGARPEQSMREQQLSEVEADVEDQTEAYIRDLLVASGLYYGSNRRSFSRWEPLGKFISYQVFEQVEDSYRHTTKAGEMCAKELREESNHKMILDLLNEVLPSILLRPADMSRYMQNAIGSSPKALHGRKLLSCLWENIQLHMHPPNDVSYYDLDDMLARDLKSNSWSSSVVDEEMNVISREIESQIIKDLIREIVHW